MLKVSWDKIGTVVLKEEVKSVKSLQADGQIDGRMENLITIKQSPNKETLINIQTLIA